MGIKRKSYDETLFEPEIENELEEKYILSIYIYIHKLFQSHFNISNGDFNWFIKSND